MAALDTVDPATGLHAGTFGLGTFESGGRVFAGLVLPGGGIVDLAPDFGDVAGIFEGWRTHFDRLRDIARDRQPTARLDDVRALPPVARPNLMCSGSNYATHVAQMLSKNSFNKHDRREGETDEDVYQRVYAKTAARRESGTPFVFTTLHSALVGATDDIVLPALGDQPDWELELGVVIGDAGRFLTLDEAQASIAGYVMLNDLGTVDIFRRTDIHFGYDWISKNQPTFKPLGPFIVPAPFLPTLEGMKVDLRVNGEVMQDWPVDDFIFSPAQVIAYLSERVRLMPGDIVAMGSPPGNGAHHGGRFLRDGDVIEASITGLGRQRNLCRAEDIGGRTPVFGLWTNAPDEPLAAPA
ncbi:MAG TPA: fumarylacetoacetate hydrolase family protein [Microbacterium sp.]|uniref:fumarylacetoacetate hydrolase family protein n=1 Tax=Microbacterium sp. TaxID=51671 RepID=UPI002CF18E16|nr:fumarylacetoacetate hydrolase family protein [Microbacterium sp.]HWI30071.1 fumarylacetoacetate hydrolase family protein [Microbacterium sp.]